MPPRTTFTVAIPTHNRADLVAMTVLSALRQTRPPVEVLVVADGCTDHTREALQALDDERVELLDLPKGPGYGYGNRNEALRRARGDMVAWLGDDDLWLPDHLEQVGDLADGTDVDLIHTPVINIDEHETFRSYALDLRVPEIRREHLDGEIGFALASVSHRPSVALEAGGWRDDRSDDGDRELWMRFVAAGGRTAMTGTPTVLQFSGKARQQAPAERIAQNRAYLERASTPEGVAWIRSEAARGAGVQLAARNAEVDELYRTRAEETAEAQRLRETLEAIERGGWWRLRRYVRPLLRVAGRLRRT